MSKLSARVKIVKNLMLDIRYHAILIRALTIKINSCKLNFNNVCNRCVLCVIPNIYIIHICNDCVT